MSFDLLAEFDSFYRAPQQGESNSISNSSGVPSTSALNDLSFFGASNFNKPIQSQAPPQQGQLQQQQQQQHQQWSIPASGPSSDVWGDLGGLEVDNPNQPVAQPVLDPWGNFGIIGNAAMLKAQGLATGPSFGDLKSSTTRMSNNDLFSSNIVGLAGSTGAHLHSSLVPFPTSQKSSKQPSVNAHAPKAASNILFDATDERDNGTSSLEDEGDEFGDFEIATSSAPKQSFIQADPPLATSKRPGELAVASNTGANSLAYAQAPKPPLSCESDLFADLTRSTTVVSSTIKGSIPKTDPPVTSRPVYAPQDPKPIPYQDSSAVKSFQGDEDWGHFSDLPAATTEPKSPKGIDADAWTWDAVDSPATEAAALKPASTPVPPLVYQAVPPTNIPPPSILLSIFPQIFNLPQSPLFQAVANQSFTIRNRILSDPSTITFLRGYILLASVAARIIAGRKLRWKRDVHLSQSMKIGPAAAAGGRGGGMKLTGVDKAEAAREDREAAELVRIWREQIGRLRSAVAAANSSIRDKATHLAVPEISETMQVKPERGALTAPKPCVLCGLKREERISKIDGEVEDSFGEWWIEHWGHRTCRNFWAEHEGKLRRR
jgi:hypothetical protein